MKQRIQFDSDGLTLVGDLYLPESFDAAQQYPAVLVDGSWTTVKEQMSGLYARRLAAQGFITLAIDHRNFGESEGQPRFWESPALKIADGKHALNYLQTVPGVDADNIFVAAICAGAGYMATLAAQDPRIKGLAMIAAWLHDSEAVKQLYGGAAGVADKIKQAQAAKQQYAETGVMVYVPAISTTDDRAAMFGPFDYYLDPARGAVPQWSADKFAVASWEDWLTFDPMPVAAWLKVPTLMIHSDHAALPDNAKRFFNAIPHGNKVLRWMQGSQFDFYDQPEQVGESAGCVSTFFKEQLVKPYQYEHVHN